MDENYLQKIWDNKRVRQRLASESPFWFSLLYLRHHFGYPLAPFHMEMFHLIEEPEYDLVVVMAFRESGKSTILNLVNILWSALGKPQKKFVIIISKTQEQAKNLFLNVKAELENNELLKNDFGPFIESQDDMKRMSLELVYHGSKIMSVHSEQSIRGLKYGPYRPDLIIADDLEDSSVLSRKERELLYDRFSKEIIPLGSRETRVFILGNLLSEDSFMMRLKEDIAQDKLKGIFRFYPLLDDNNRILWQEKFKDMNDIKKLRAKFSSKTWRREYLLTLGEDNSEYDPDPPQDLKINESDSDIITNYYEHKIAKLQNKYSEVFKNSESQKNLVQQMAKYTISVPDVNEFVEPEPGDPSYEKYQEYENECKKLIKNFEDALYRAVQVRILEKGNRKRAEMGLDPVDIHSYLNRKINCEDIDWGDEPEYTEYGNLEEEVLEVKKKESERMERIKDVGYWDPDLRINEK